MWLLESDSTEKLQLQFTITSKYFKYGNIGCTPLKANIADRNTAECKDRRIIVRVSSSAFTTDEPSEDIAKLQS